MAVTESDISEGRFYLGRDGKVVRQVDYRWNAELVSFREFDADKGHPIRFHQTWHTQAFLSWVGRMMSPSETGYLQVTEADRLQELESERRWKALLELIPDDRLIGEAGRRGCKVEAPPKRNPLARYLTIHFRMNDEGKGEPVGPMGEEERLRIAEQMRAEAVQRGPLDSASLVQPVLLGLGGTLCEFDSHMCRLYFSLIRSGATVNAEHLVIEAASSTEGALPGGIVGRAVRLVFGTEMGVLEVPLFRRPCTARQFVRLLAETVPASASEKKSRRTKRAK